MGKFFVLFFFFPLLVLSQVRVLSWNLQNFGKSKGDSQLAFIARTVRDADIVALVEVVAGHGGVQAVSRLAGMLNRTGTSWDYVVSVPTTGSKSSERYAVLWKVNRVRKAGMAALDTNYAATIEREPYFVSFSSGSREFTLVLFHAVPKSKQPEREISYFKNYPRLFPGKNLIICGDFNCPETNNVFVPLKKMGYSAAVHNTRTTLKMEPAENGECLASEYDNLFYQPARVKVLKSGVLPFHKQFPSLRDARKLSDHLPVFADFLFN
jgi:deoxyribonuclease-1-like protein